jgi:sulfide:quinone oxidoreductase
VKHRIVILGGGTGGTIMANRLRRAFDRDAADVVVVDRDDQHVYQPGLLFVPFGLADPAEIVRSRRAQLHAGIEFVQAAVDRVDMAGQRVELVDHRPLSYDLLVVASGSRLVPEETEGMIGPGWGRSVHTFYDRDGAATLAGALKAFPGGRVVVNLVDMPIKCPVAPLEFAFLADWYFRERGIRDAVDLSYVTPLDGAFTKPIASGHLSGLLEQKNVSLVTEFAVGEVDGAAGRLVSYDQREQPFDLLVTVPLHSGAEFIGRSPGLGDELGFVPTDQHTLQSKTAANVFAIGDATNLPTSKAGSVTHFEADVLTGNIRRFLEGHELSGQFDGHANCFIETGFGKALLIDFNYETEPLPGRFPAAHLGLPLMAESRLNHLGKLMFQWLYWHVLLPGRDVPGLHSELSMSGKRTPVREETPT